MGRNCITVSSKFLCKLWMKTQMHLEEIIIFSLYYCLMSLKVKGALWAPYNRIIFELFDRLCQIIENRSVLLIKVHQRSHIIVTDSTWYVTVRPTKLVSEPTRIGHIFRKNKTLKKKNQKDFTDFQHWKMTLKIRISRSLSAS